MRTFEHKSREEILEGYQRWKKDALSAFSLRGSLTTRQVQKLIPDCASPREAGVKLRHALPVALLRINRRAHGKGRGVGVYRLLPGLCLLLCVSSFAQTGQCHATGAGNNNGASCTVDSGCTGTGGGPLSSTPYCGVLKHIIFIVKENRAFDAYFGLFPGVTGGPVGTASHPYVCSGSFFGCVSGSAPAYAANPTVADNDCGHQRYNAINDYDQGAMDQFNNNCGTTNLNWAHAYGTACSDWPTSHQLCTTNADCTSGSCNQNTLPTYWSYATSYGLADHFFSSMLGPSAPAHEYLWAGSSSDLANNPAMKATNNGVNGNLQQQWNCDSYHYGRCSNAATTLCSTNGDCSGGGTCSINLGTGTGYYNPSNSCTSDSDLNFSLTNIVGSGTTATATCATNCGLLAVGQYVAISGNSVSAFNTGTLTTVQVLTVTGSPVTSFTFASATASTGTGGAAAYDNCVNGNVYQAAALYTLGDIDNFTPNGADFSISGISANGTTGTATCTTNCGNLVVGSAATFTGASYNLFNTNGSSPTYIVATVTGSPVTSFTFPTTINHAATGGTVNYSAYYPGTCSTNNAIACKAAATTAYSGLSSSTATDISGACGGGTCNVGQSVGSLRGGACPNITSIADKLDGASVSWKVYSEHGGEQWNPAAYFSHIRYGADWTNNVNSTIGQFLTDAAACTSDASCSAFPQVTWTMTGQANTDYSEHPAGTVALGQVWTSQRVNAVMNNSYLWRHSVVFIFSDDWGGFYDHLAPSVSAGTWNNGFRVPAMCVGAYCTNAVNTTVFTFESALKCLEVQYGLSAVGTRDSAANDLCTSAGGMVNLALANATLSGRLARARR